MLPNTNPDVRKTMLRIAHAHPTSSFTDPHLTQSSITPIETHEAKHYGTLTHKRHELAWRQNVRTHLYTVNDQLRLIRFDNNEFKSDFARFNLVTAPYQSNDIYYIASQQLVDAPDIENQFNINNKLRIQPAVDDVQPDYMSPPFFNLKRALHPKQELEVIKHFEPFTAPELKALYIQLKDLLPRNIHYTVKPNENGNIPTFVNIRSFSYAYAIESTYIY